MKRMALHGLENDEGYKTIGYLTPFMVNGVCLKNPVVVAWWSAALSGYGHFLIGNYGIGFILLLHEYIINNLMGLNRALLYSFIGDFKSAKEALDLQWTLAYAPPYVFGIWDSYNRTKQYNGEYIIARQKGYRIINRGLSATGINRLNLKNPIMAVCWSFLAPGSGQLYINRILITFLVPWLVITMYLANGLTAVHLSFIGDFELAKEVLDPQWFLFLPSIYGFMAYDAYLHTLENNELYKLDQRNYLVDNYQSENFPCPFGGS